MSFKEQISKKFIDFFLQNGHYYHDAAKLVRNKDTIFTVAGMQQFQDFFLGFKKPNYPSYVTAQPCLRISGKHNDLENIGFTTRHNTFFTMLGNFSFGALQKQDAIRLAWEFLESIGINKNYLYVTVHSSDVQAYKLWQKHLTQDRIVIIDSSDNFWQVGDLGLCGPCTEIFFDTKKRTNLEYDVLCQSIQDGVDLLEIWNIVFMEFNRTRVGLEPLQSPCIDTGMGLERLVSVLEGHFNNFQVEPIKTIKQKLEQHGCKLKYSSLCADHIYTIRQLLNENLQPGPKGAEYILRLLIRQCYKVFDKLDDFMNHPIITQEIQHWNNIVNKNKTILNNLEQVDEETLVQLYHTHGLPEDSLEYYADKYSLDYNKITLLVAKHKQTSKRIPVLNHQEPTKQLCYDPVDNNSAIITNLFNLKGEKQNTIQGKCYIIVDQTCFYGEGGGQPGDTGKIVYTNNNEQHDIIVENCTKQKLSNGQCVVIHHCNTKSPIQIGATVHLYININKRLQHTRAHSGTHVLSEILMFKYNKQIAGSALKQDKYTLDFRGQPFDQNTINDIFQQCNAAIHQQLPQETIVTNCSNVSHIFGADKHSPDNKVRVVKFGNKFQQLCGGTHVANTKDIIHITLQKQKRIGSEITRLFVLVGQEQLPKQQNISQQTAEILFRNNNIIVYNDKKINHIADMKHWHLNIYVDKDRIKGILYNFNQIDIEKLENIGCKGKAYDNKYSFGHRCTSYQQIIQLFNQ